MRRIAILLLLVTSRTCLSADILIEAESFSSFGGWVLDPQFLDVMGSPYLLAHGLGAPVENATTMVQVVEPGTYVPWIRTKRWVTADSARHSDHPGAFQLIINGKELPDIFGATGEDWHWQKATAVELDRGEAELALCDLTGFDGRCDAILLTTNQSLTPPPEPNEAMAVWRRHLLRMPDTPPPAGDFDVVVIGGGIAGCSSALAAARLGLRVALIQNRPVLGGNGSTEIGITPRGSSRSIVNELVRPPRKQVFSKEPNAQLFLGWHAFRVQKNGASIQTVDAMNTRDSRELRFEAPVFVDCTGVGAVGYLAGAEFRLGRESRDEFGESLAPEKADTMHHGNTVVFRTVMTDHRVSFPEVPWAVAISGNYAELGGQVVDGRDNIGGLTHFWEFGQWLDPLQEAETVRDHLFCAIYGTFSNVKRRYPQAAANLQLDWVGYVPAGGESRRLMGDYILTENDIRAQKSFPDAVASCSGYFCLHYPGTDYDFRLGDWKFVPVKPYSIPFRCLYSRNIDNLLMAGKHISVSHIAGASTKTMLNGGQMGVATAAAAFLCQKHGVRPRDLYHDHLAELQAVVTESGSYRGCFAQTDNSKSDR